MDPRQEDESVPVSIGGSNLPWNHAMHPLLEDGGNILNEGVGKDGEGVNGGAFVVPSSGQLPSALFVHLAVDVDGEEALLVNHTVGLALHYLTTLGSCSRMNNCSLDHFVTPQLGNLQLHPGVDPHLEISLKIITLLHALSM